MCLCIFAGLYERCTHGWRGKEQLSTPWRYCVAAILSLSSTKLCGHTFRQRLKSYKYKQIINKLSLSQILRLYFSTCSVILVWIIWYNLDQTRFTYKIIVRLPVPSMADIPCLHSVYLWWRCKYRLKYPVKYTVMTLHKCDMRNDNIKSNSTRKTDAVS